MTRKCSLLVATIIAAGVVCAAGALAETPTLMFSTVLNGVKMDPNTGAMYLHNIQVSNLPTPANTTYHPYNPHDGDKLWAMLVGTDGTAIARFDFYAQLSRQPWWLLGSYEVTDLRPGMHADAKRVAVPDGDYTLDFHLATGRFYSLPLKVASAIGPSGAGKTTLLSGDWNNWGYLLYGSADPSQQLVWKMWLRVEQPGQEQGMRVMVNVTRDADGTLICTSRPNRTTSVQAEWSRREFDLIHPMQGTSGGAMFYASEMLNVPGSYTLKVNIDEEQYGSWKFQVQGGQLVKIGRADPATADPLTFVDGGVDAWWYGREEAAAVPVVAGASTAVIPGATRIEVNGITLVPMRSIFEWLGAEVRYVPQARSITANRDDEIIVLMRLDETDATVNAKKVPMGITPQQRDGVTYVPLRFVAETFGATVGFDAGAITITDGDRVGLIP